MDDFDLTITANSGEPLRFDRIVIYNDATGDVLLDSNPPPETCTCPPVGWHSGCPHHGTPLSL